MRSARKSRRTSWEVFRSRGYEIRVLGAPRPNFRDAYHWLLRIPWWGAIGAVAATFFGLNVIFAAGYLVTGGLANAARGSFADAFFFSVETMATVGYGSMYPASFAANVLASVEALVGILVTALATGLAFSRFSQLRARVAFSSRVACAPVDGTPALQIRVGNERRGRIVDVSFRLSVLRSTRTREGVQIYRTFDLPLLRDHAPSLSRSWMVLHVIGPESPLHGDTAESLAAAEAELTLQVKGTDEASGQSVHALRTWMAPDLAFGARLADILTETPDGNMVLDLERFHDVVPADAPPAEEAAPAARP